MDQAGKIEAKATGLEADKEEVGIAFLEGLHGVRAVLPLRRAVEILVGDAQFIQNGPDDVQMADELREDESLVVGGDKILDELHERLKLRARHIRLRFNEFGVAGGLAELRDGGDDTDAVLFGGTALLTLQFIDEAKSNSFIERTFLFGEFDEVRYFGLRWQLLEHLVFVSSKKERLDNAIETFHLHMVFFIFNR